MDSGRGGEEREFGVGLKLFGHRWMVGDGGAAIEKGGNDK